MALKSITTVLTLHCTSQLCHLHLNFDHCFILFLGPGSHSSGSSVFLFGDIVIILCLPMTDRVLYDIISEMLCNVLLLALCINPYSSFFFSASCSAFIFNLATICLCWLPNHKSYHPMMFISNAVLAIGRSWLDSFCHSQFSHWCHELFHHVSGFAEELFKVFSLCLSDLLDEAADAITSSSSALFMWLAL